ncbi:MAG: large conductance mechanosensitive channel protein MscL [Bacilli bacterium]|nr:large conductance mechanosensitive channel protein MscL [Bacilli bacterium]
MKNKVKGFIKEFKEFIKRGNVIDLAVGVVIGTAFTKIVNSIVNDIIMPLVGIILGGLDFSNLVLKVRDSSILFGSFINNVLSFFIIAICVFLLVKFINRFMRKKEVKEEVKVEEPKKSNEELLLEDILKELKKSNKAKK